MTWLDEIDGKTFGNSYKGKKQIEGNQNENNLNKMDDSMDEQEQFEDSNGDEYSNSDYKNNSNNQDFTNNGDSKGKKSNSEIIENTATQIMNKYGLVTVEETTDILCYKNGVYVEGGDILIQKEAEKICGYDLSNRLLNEIIGHIRRNTFHSISEFDSNIYIINMKNGLYNLNTGNLMKHTSEYLSRRQKPISYDPTIKPKYFGKFLNEVLYPTEIRTAVEAMAYTFWQENQFEILVTLHGIGANGKSVYLGLISNLHGSENVSNVSLSSMINNRFALADLECKDVNIDSEMSSGTISSTSVLKKLTGKQSIRIERKNQNAYDTRIHATLFFSGNTIPISADSSDGYHRRNIILSFPNQFINEKEDPYMLEKLTSQEELSGIFNVLIPVLRRLLKSKGIFVNEKTIAERRERYERATDPIQAFLTEAVVEESTETDIEIKQEVYRAYELYCKKFLLPIEAKETFGKKLKKRYADGREASGERRTFWKGIQLKNESRTEPIQILIISSTQ